MTGTKATGSDLFKLQDRKEVARKLKPLIHIMKNCRYDTEQGDMPLPGVGRSSRAPSMHRRVLFRTGKGYVRCAGDAESRYNSAPNLPAGQRYKVLGQLTKFAAATRITQLHVRRGLLVGLAALLVTAAVSQFALAQNFEPLPGRTETRVIEGQEIRLKISPEIKVTTEGGKNRLDLRVRIGLGDLQAKAVGILNSMIARQGGSGVDWSFPALAAPVAADGALKISGSIRAEKRLLGIRTRETANFLLALRPQHTSTTIIVAGALEHFDLGNSLLGDVGMEGFLRDFVAAEISKALSAEDAMFMLPEELRVFGFTIIEVNLVDIGNGVAEIAALATTELDGPELTKALATLATVLSK